MGSVNWKWFIVGGVAGYLGAAFLPKFIPQLRRGA